MLCWCNASPGTSTTTNTFPPSRELLRLSEIDFLRKYRDYSFLRLKKIDDTVVR